MKKVQKSFKKKLLTFICLLLTLFTWADSGHLYTSDKLPSSLINCIIQDHYGYIWIGTEYGLSRFDGYRFTNYLHDEKDNTTITDNTISSLYVDKYGKLWIGSSKGFMRYDYHKDHFIRYSFPKGCHPRVFTIREDHKGNLLIGTAGYGLYAIPSGQDKIVFQKEFGRRLSNDYFNHIFEDSHGYLWQSSHLSTFTRYDIRGEHPKSKTFTSPYGAPVAFFQSQPNQLLIVCMFGIITYEYPSGCLRDAGYNYDPYSKDITINSATIDHKRNLYIGTSEYGVLVAKKGEKHFSPINISDNNLDISSAYVKDIMEDKDHNIWIACYKKGLYLVNNDQEVFHQCSFASQDYRVGTCISSITPGDKNTTWCTVQNSGVFQFNHEGKIISHPSSPAGTSLIYRDKNGQYWLGTSNALYSYNPYTGSATQRLKFESAGVYCMTDNGDGKLYISVYSKGLYIYDTKSNKVKVLNMSMRGRYGALCNDWVRHLTFDHQGMLWIATSSGICCMDPTNYRFNCHGWTRILNNIQTNYLCEDEDGNIIIGTDNGLYRYMPRTNRVTNFPEADGLKGKQICAIVKDAQNDLWISTTMGIWQYQKKEHKFISYTKGNGLTSHEYVNGAVLHSDNDLIGFGNSDGIAFFYPSTVNKNNIILGKTYLTNFIVDGENLDTDHTKFNVSYNQNTFTLEFSLLNYKNTQDISFQYRINDGEWITTAEGVNAIPFVNLQPGTYYIDVRAISNGVPSNQITKLEITVDSPWYSSAWACMIYLILLGVILYYSARAYDRHKKADLDEQKMRFLIDATHDIRSPLTLIMAPLKKLKERITDKESRSELTIIEKNAQRLLLLVNQILDERKIDKDQMHLHCQETDLVKFTANIVKLYAYNAKERNITLTFRHDIKELPVWIDRINFDKVISNLLSNALKYTFDNGDIQVILSKQGNKARLIFQDSGIGFKEEKTDRLFERFYQGNNTHGLHIIGTGIGLNLCQALVEMHHGTISARNRQDGQRGAIFEVNIPLGNAHLTPQEIKESDEIEENEANFAKTKRKKQGSKNYHILIVDDDPEISRYIESELGEWYKFEIAYNGKEGLQKLLSGSYDLVISDIMMPEMDGITFLKSIKSNSNISDIPVVLLTSKSEVDYRLQGLKKGADAFLAKPFDMEELHILIDNIVSNIRRLKGKFSGAQKQESKLTKVQVTGNNEALMDRIMKCINENIGSSEFNVEKLAEEVGVSRAQLHRKMKEITGISTGEFIRNIRLEQAARLIDEGTINITQVAYAVGFSNQTHFSTLFKRHYGISPSEYSHRTSEKKTKEI